MVNLINGDCLDKLRELDDNSVDSIVTDPPYGLSFMGKRWDYDVPSKEVWTECMRVLKPGGYLLSFGGSRTYHRMAVEIEDAGFEIRDQIMWVYGSGFPKSHNVGKAVDKLLGNDNSEWEGWGTALKPAHEPIVMARKPFKGTVANNVMTYGTGAINIDGCRVGTGTGEVKTVEYPDITGDNYNQGKSNYSERGKVIREVKDQGRYPANFIHDGSDEVVELFPDKAGSLFNGTRTKFNDGGSGNTIKGTKGKPGMSNGYIDEPGSAARFFYCAKASKKDRNAGCEGMPEKDVVTFATANGTSGKASSLSEGRDTKYQNNHPTVKPNALMRYLCRLVTRPGGVVLDPFMGSGSTGRAALEEGFSFIGIEREPEYFAIAEARCGRS